MLVGSAAGGVAAAEIAAAASSASFTVDQVVTAGAPSAQVPDPARRAPACCRWRTAPIPSRCSAP